MGGWHRLLLAEFVDEGLDVFDGSHQTSSGVLEFSAEVGNPGAGIINVHAKGGNEFIVGVPVALEH